MPAPQPPSHAFAQAQVLKTWWIERAQKSPTSRASDPNGRFKLAQGRALRYVGRCALREARCS